MMIFSYNSFSKGLTIEDIKDGTTVKMNRILVDDLNKTDFIENYVSVLGKYLRIMKILKKPKYKMSDNGIVLILHNRNCNNVPNNIKKSIIKNAC